MEREIIAKICREKKATIVVTGILLSTVFVLFGVGMYIFIGRSASNSLFGLKIFMLSLFCVLGVIVDIFYFIHAYRQNTANENVILYEKETRTFFIETKNGLRSVKAKAISKTYLNSPRVLYNGSFLSSSYKKNGPIIINVEGEKKIKSYVVNDVAVVNYTIRRICGINVTE